MEGKKKLMSLLGSAVILGLGAEGSATFAGEGKCAGMKGETQQKTKEATCAGMKKEEEKKEEEKTKKKMKEMACGGQMVCGGMMKQKGGS